jgi:NAD(P)-dependent dehydrogenase (short-subunit alcohol dehydrogenase family)
MTEQPIQRAASGQARIAVVNGASGGIGFALVRELLADSNVAMVFATSRHASTDTRLAKLAVNETTARLRALDMDVTDEVSVAATAASIGAAVEQLDLIVNCAGLLHAGSGLQPEKRLADVTPENLQHSFAVNAVGPLLIGKHFQTLLHRQQRAVFASLSARVGSIGDNRLGGWYSYRAAKAAQNMITRNLSIELRRRARGIICVALHPGTVDTELSRPFQSRVSDQALFTPERAARQLLTVIDALQPVDNGGFFAWDAQRIVW